MGFGEGILQILKLPHIMKIRLYDKAMNKMKLVPCLRQLFIFIIVVFSPEISFAAADELQPSQCEFGEAVSERLNYQSVAGIPMSYVPDPDNYVQEIASNDTVLDIREERFDRDPSRIFIDGAIKLPLYRVKSKTYLKKQRLVLVGDGLDDYFIENEIVNLKDVGFARVKILEYGVSALIGTGKLRGDAASSLNLRSASAEKLVGGAMGGEQAANFLFINLGSANSSYSELGLKKKEILFSDDKRFYTQLYDEVISEIEENDSIRVVLIHDDPKVYNQIAQSRDMFDMLGLWFMEDGNQGLTELKEKISSTLAISKRVKTSCAG